MIELNGLVVLVTGGSRGLGAEIVRAMTAAGARVAFTYVSRREEATALAAEVGGDALPLQADARDFARAHAVVEEVSSRFGRVDALVANAGFARGGALWKLTESDWDDVVDVSLKGAFNYIHAVAPGFIERQEGRIVCIGSINGLRGRIGSASYNAAKAGMVGLVKSAAAELGRYNVTANLVAPGFIETDSQHGTSELIRDLVLKECAIKRLASPQDIVPLVTFLASKAARHITGQTIKVDAGQYL